MDTVLHDFRHGIRTLRKNPGFTAIAAATLGLGIGAATIIFSFVNGVILRPLPFKDSRSLVMVVQPRDASSIGSMGDFVGPDDVLDWEAKNHVFETMAAFRGAAYNLTGSGEPERLPAANVTSRFFEALAAAPMIGRTFSPYEGQPGADRVVVISSALWRRRFHSDPSLLGQSITLDGNAFTVIGVMPDGFRFPGEVLMGPLAPHLPHDIDAWVPIALQRAERNVLLLGVIARLRSDVTIDRAQAEMSAIASRSGEHGTSRGPGIKVVSLQTRIAQGVRRLLFIFLAAVGCLLLIACANVANLLLARATARQKEVAIRTALGSSRWRLIRQFLAESTLLGLLGGVIGLIWALWGTDIVAHFVPPGSVPRLREVAIDGRVLAFTAAVSFLTSVIFGLAPALQASRLGGASPTRLGVRHWSRFHEQAPGPNLVIALKDADATQSSTSRVLATFIVAEVMVAFVLMAGAGLLIKSFVRLITIDPGFKAANVLTVSLMLPETSYETPVQMSSFAASVLERLESAPAVRHVGVVDWLPFGGSLLWGDFVVEGSDRRGQELYASKLAISPGYFAAIGIPVLRGRPFTERDIADSIGVVIVNEQVARRVWPGQDPIGKRLEMWGRSSEKPWQSVVGIVGDVKQNTLAERPRLMIYQPLAQAPPHLLRTQTFVVRSTLDPQSLAASVRHEIQAVDPNLPADRIATMGQLLDASISEPRFRSVLLGSFAGAAVVLVAVGILGVLAYSVSRRAREIGIRMALGAPQLDLVRSVVGHALLMTVTGIALGLVGAAVLTRFLSSFLFEVRPLDPATLAAAAIAMVVVALVASYVPARRATKVDPLTALRTE